ncbi:MAG TPA: MATE family efflux transporter [Caulobacteraceae bacterium]|nr:MATE family efflux transporter [Caulobacteraceae bacterium]
MKHDPTAAQKPLWQVFLVFLGPLMLSNVLQSLSGTINTIFLGQMIGVDALAAATVFFPVTFFFVALVIGMGAGASVLIGQAWGAGEVDKVKAVAGTALTVTAAAGLAIALFGGFFARGLMVGMRTPAEILEPATAYARVILIGMPFFFVFILATSMLRGVGDTVTPLWALVVSTIVGLALTPALITGFAGLPRLGPASAAVAGVVGQIAGLLWMGWRMSVRNNPLAPDRALMAHLKPELSILAKVMRIGVPTGVQMVTVAMSELVLVWLVNRHGASVTAAYGAVNQVIAYVQFPAMSIAISSSILGAQAIGAGHADRLPMVMRAGQMINLVLTGAGAVLVYIFAGPIVSLFITDKATHDLTCRLLYIVVWSMVAFGGSGVFAGVMRASGTVWVPMINTMIGIVVVEVPTAFILDRTIGVEGIWVGYPALFCAMFCLQGGYYALVWRKKRVERLI